MITDSDKELQGKTHINIVAYNQTLLIVGQATDQKLKDRASELVKEVPNVKRICNQMTIGTPITMNQISTDSWITTKVKSALLGTTDLKSTRIKVVTEDSVCI